MRSYFQTDTDRIITESISFFQMCHTLTFIRPLFLLNPRGWPTVNYFNTYRLSIRPHFSKSPKTKQLSSEYNDHYCPVLLWVWPNGSLMTSVFYIFPSLIVVVGLSLPGLWWWLLRFLAAAAECLLQPPDQNGRLLFLSLGSPDVVDQLNYGQDQGNHQCNSQEDERPHLMGKWKIYKLKVLWICWRFVVICGFLWYFVTTSTIARKMKGHI